MPKQIVNISDTVKSFQEKVNIISADVGWRGNLTTTEDSDIVGAINEHDAELGTITAGAMGTTASTVSTAIAELDGRLDSANNTQINSAKLFMRDSAALNIIKGNLNLHGNMDIDGTLTVDGVVNFKAGTNGSVTLGDANTDNVVFSADVNSHIIPNTDSAYDLGSSSQQWRNIYVDGVGFIDNVQADDAKITGTLDVDTSATIATAKIEDLTNNRVVIVGTGGELEDDANLTFDGSTLTVAGTLDVNTSATIATAKIEDLTNNRVVIVGTGGELEDDANFTFDGTTFNLNGNVDVGNGLDVTGNITVTGTVDGRDIAADGALLDTHDSELGTISAAAMGTTASTVSGAILELETEIDTLNTKVEPGQALTTTATTLSDAINELDAELGTISTGVMGTTASNVGAAIGELEGEIDTLNTKVEPARALTTTATTLSGAVNELKGIVDLLDSGAASQLAEIGDLSTLDTTAKDTLVNAINELDDRIDTDADFRNKVSGIDSGGDGSFRYVQATGKFIYKGPTATEVRAHFSAGEGIDISSGSISGENATSTNKGIAKFDTSNFSVSSGNVTIKNNGVILGTETTGNYVDSAVGGTGITVSHTPGEGSTVTVAITSGGVDTTQLAADAVTNAKIADNAVDIAQLAHRTANHVLKMNSSGTPTSGTIATANIADDAVTGAKIADDAIDSEHYTNGSIDRAHLAADIIDSTKIADDAINSEHYADGSIDTAHIANDQVTYAKIQNVVTANRVLGSTTADGAVNEVQVSTAMIAADAVTGAKIADDAINSEHYTNGSIDAAHLASNSVTKAKIADDAVGSAELDDVVTLIIKNSAGTALKTIYGAGS